MKNEKPWFKIEADDFYGEYDTPYVKRGPKWFGSNKSINDHWPDDTKIKNKQKIQVRWPDGRVTTEILSIVTGWGSVQVDMNATPDQYESRNFYAEIKYHGKKVNIPLRKMMVKPV